MRTRTRRSPAGNQAARNAATYLTAERARNVERLRLARLSGRLHRLEARPVGAALAILLAHLEQGRRAEALAEITAIADLPPRLVRVIGADAWPQPPLRAVAGRP